MTSNPTDERLTKKQRQQKSREEKAAKLRAEAARRRARQRTYLVSGAVVAVIAVVIGIFVVVQGAQRDRTASAAPPANLGSGNSFVVGNADAKVTVVAYEDFICPYCEQFEQTNADQIDTWIKAGTVRMEYRPIAFLDASSSTKYSTRALNAAAAVENSKPAAFQAFHRLLFANQPKEGSAGLSDATLADLAGQAGADKTVVAAALKDKTYEAWATSATDAASKAGITGTPTLMVNGTKLDGFDSATLKTAVEAAAAKAE